MADAGAPDQTAVTASEQRRRRPGRRTGSHDGQPEGSLAAEQVEAGVPVHERDRQHEGQRLDQLAREDRQRVLRQRVAAVGERVGELGRRRWSRTGCTRSRRTGRRRSAPPETTISAATATRAGVQSTYAAAQREDDGGLGDPAQPAQRELVGAAPGPAAAPAWSSSGRAGPMPDLLADPLDAADEQVGERRCRARWRRRATPTSVSAKPPRVSTFANMIQIADEVEAGDQRRCRPSASRTTSGRPARPGPTCRRCAA